MTLHLCQKYNNIGLKDPSTTVPIQRLSPLYCHKLRVLRAGQMADPVRPSIPSTSVTTAENNLLSKHSLGDTSSRRCEVIPTTYSRYKKKESQTPTPPPPPRAGKKQALLWHQLWIGFQTAIHLSANINRWATANGQVTAELWGGDKQQPGIWKLKPLTFAWCTLRALFSALSRKGF